MLILAVDTSSPLGSLAVLRDTTVIAERVSSSRELYSAGLLRDTEELLGTSRISFEEIELFAVDAGPGSFTGLRVGLTAVKAWAEVWRRPIAQVSGLEAMAAQVFRSERRPAAASVSMAGSIMDARRGQIFGAIFRGQQGDSGGLQRVGDEMLATVDEFLGFVRTELGEARGLVIACVSPEGIQAALERQGLGCCQIDVVSGALAPFIGRLGYAKAVRGDVVDALHLDANYIRRPDAEVNWKGG